MFCSSCGTAVQSEASYCPSCGAAIPTQLQTVPTSTVEPKTSVHPRSKRPVVLGALVVGLAAIVAIALLIVFGFKNSNSPSSIVAETSSLLNIPCHPALIDSQIPSSERSTVSSLYSCDRGRIQEFSLDQGEDAKAFLRQSTEDFGLYEYIVGSHWFVEIFDGALPLSSIRQISPGTLSKDIGGSIWPSSQPTSLETSPERGCNGWHFCSGTASSTYHSLGPPTVGQTWHAALVFDICGTIEPVVPTSPTSATSGLTTTGGGVLLIAPRDSSEAGIHATLGNFASEYPGMTLTNTAVKYPGGAEYLNGEKCAAGTPEAGEQGQVRVRSWTLSQAENGKLIKQVGGTYPRDPADLKLLNQQLITVGFGPSSKTLPRVPATVELLLLQTIEGTVAPSMTTTLDS